MYETIAVENLKGGAWRLTLNRPDARNALSIKMRREISDALAKLAADSAVGALVITGSGDTFCAGFDLKEFGRPDIFNDVFESSSRYHRDVFHFPKPTIAAINGNALGGGFDLATLCDVRLCSPSAKFAHPEIKFGGPPLFTPLWWIVGHGAAKDLCLTGRRITADDALRIGLISEIVPADALPARALEFAKTILEAPAATLSLAKRYMNDAPSRDFEQSFTAEHDDVFKSLAPKKA